MASKFPELSAPEMENKSQLNSKLFKAQSWWAWLQKCPLKQMSLKELKEELCTKISTFPNQVQAPIFPVAPFTDSFLQRGASI